MSDKKPHVTILDADDPEFAEKLGEAIGAEPGDTINVTGPQFERPDDAPPEPSVPADDEAWLWLKDMTPTVAKARGLGSWDGGLFLFPGSWFAHVPDWLVVEDITGDVSRWGARTRSDDIRFGCLAYGVRLGPATVETDQ